MKRLRGILLGVVLMVLLATPLWALAPSAGTVTSFSDKQIAANGMRLWQVSYVTHSSAGTFTSSTDMDITGWIVHVETDPGATAPDDNYNITLKNTNGRDIMGGSLATRDTANTEAVLPLLNGNYQAVWNEGPLSIAVSAAGNSKTIELLIYYLP